MKNKAMLMVDAHEDLAWNMLTFSRDYRLSATETRSREKDSLVPGVNGDTMLGLVEYRAVNMAVVFATLFTAPIHAKEGEWDIMTYKDSQQAHLQCLNQLAAYERLTGENPAQFTPIISKTQLQKQVSAWEDALISGATVPPVGLVYLMEGADGIRVPGEVEEWYERGVRIFGLAWQATRYSGGTKEPGPLTHEGVELVKRIEELGAILDISHMDEQAVRQAFSLYDGSIIASHSNPFTPNKDRESNRFLKDDVILSLAERGGMIGVVPYNLFLDPGWDKGSRKDDVTLAMYVDQVDYICQLLGTADHVGIGTDFDGGFGLQSTPAELDSLTDVPRIIPLLEKKGYTGEQVAGIIGKNWLEYLLHHLP